MPESAWNVVVVDDNFDDMQVVITMLEYYSINVYAAASAQECSELMNHTIPDLVITDLAMPEADGWAVLDAIRNNPAAVNTRVVAMTSYHSAKLANEVMNAGFDGYLPKPINPDDFIQQLQEIMAR